VADVNNAGASEIIYDSHGTGPDVNVENWPGVVDIFGVNDNGSTSPGGDNNFEVRWINNIEPRDVAAVGNIGGGHAINNIRRDVAVVNNIGNTKFINDSC
jgi:hypothetical protein